MQKIMLVDDEENILSSLKRVLRNEGWDIETYTNPLDALKRATTANFDVFVSDYRMPEMNGADFLSQVKELQPETMRIILSGYADLESLVNAINKAEIYRFVSKPWQDYELITSIKKALEYKQVLLENRILADQLRAQTKELEKRKSAIEYYQREHPEILSVNWASDGSIIVDDPEI